jgi:hypothetical protein
MTTYCSACLIRLPEDSEHNQGVLLTQSGESISVVHLLDPATSLLHCPINKWVVRVSLHVVRVVDDLAIHKQLQPRVPCNLVLFRERRVHCRIDLQRQAYRNSRPSADRAGDRKPGTRRTLRQGIGGSAIFFFSSFSATSSNTGASCLQ